MEIADYICVGDFNLHNAFCVLDLFVQICSREGGERCGALAERTDADEHGNFCLHLCCRFQCARFFLWRAFDCAELQWDCRCECCGALAETREGGNMEISVCTCRGDFSLLVSLRAAPDHANLQWDCKSERCGALAENTREGTWIFQFALAVEISVIFLLWDVIADKAEFCGL